MNTYQALRTLKADSNSSTEVIKANYRKMALQLHPDRNKNEDAEFKRITEAYNYLKENYIDAPASAEQAASASPEDAREKFRSRPQWGADQEVPEQRWDKFTRGFEESDPDFWKEYESKFWEDYNAGVRPDGKNGEFEKAHEPKAQPDLAVSVDKSLCIGCCSCEIIAPDVFEINKESMMNPKSSVINPAGAGVNKIMSAAETCPTKAISVDDLATKERLYPY